MKPMRTAEDFVAGRGHFILVWSLALAAFSISFCLRVGESTLDTAVWALAWALWALIDAGYVLGFAPRFGRAGQSVINDELARAHRSRALELGFGTLVAGVLSGCLGPVGLWTPPAWWPIAALSAALVATGLTFAVLELRTDA